MTGASDDKIRVRMPREGQVWELKPLELSPCTLACPTRINVRGYVSLIADGRFDEALALIRQRNPFPGVCGRICPRPCESACIRAKHDEAIAICSLKRFVFDLEMQRGLDIFYPRGKNSGDSVAIIGAGPAGLSAALELVRLGHAVTVFDAKQEPGGMMNLIPSFRLPPEIVRRECKAIISSGVQFVGGVRFGKELTWGKLKRKGFKALLLACGAWKQVPSLKGLASRSIIHALELLEAAKNHDGKSRDGICSNLPGKRVIVSGTGTMALDSARTALRLGASEVIELVGARRELAPFQRSDLEYAEKEGVHFEFLAKAKRIGGAGRKGVVVHCISLSESEPDATGRRYVIEEEGSGFSIEADLLIDADARSTDFCALARGMGLEPGILKSMVGGIGGLSSRFPGVFMAGDMVTGPRSVVEAIASGVKAAHAIHGYLIGSSTVSPLDIKMDERINEQEFAVELVSREKLPRTIMPVWGARDRKRDFREVERGFRTQQAREEAQRCLRCGPCAECPVCVDICEKKDFILKLDEERTLTVHAGREFWSRSADTVEIEAGEIELEANIARTKARVSEELCVGCGRCSQLCSYRAIQVEPRSDGSFIARVDELSCKGCGNCVSVCPTGALDQINFETQAIARRLQSVSRISKVLFVCKWARPALLGFPRDVVVIESMCIGRVEPRFVLEAALRGSHAIMVVGCEQSACRYGFGRAAGHEVVERSRKMLRLFGISHSILTEASTSPAEFSLALDKWAWRSK